MTKELEVIQRQALEQSISLPRNTANAGLQQGFNQLSKIGAFAAETLAVKQAGIEGAAAARSDPQKVRNLAPGFTNATKAFNASFNHVQTNMNTIGGAKILDEKLRIAASPENLNANSLSDYIPMAEAVVEGTIQGTNPENRADVALRLNAHMMGNIDKLTAKVEEFNHKKKLEKLDLSFTDSLSNLKEEMLTGTKESQKLAFQEAQASIDDYANLSGITPTGKIKLERTLAQTVINATLEREYSEAVVKGGEAGGVKYITDFIKGKAENQELTSGQKEQGKEFLLKTATSLQKEVNYVGNQGYNNIVELYQTDPTADKSIQGLENNIQKQSDEGFPLTQVQRNNIRSKILTQDKAAAKRAATNAAINSAVTSNGFMGGFTGKELNDWYNESLIRGAEAIATEVAEGKRDPESVPAAHMQEAYVASRAKASIPNFTSRMSARLTSTNPEDIKNGLEQYTFMEGNNKDGLAGVNNKVAAYARQLHAKILNTNDLVNVQTVAAEAKEGVLEADPKVMKLRLDAQEKFATDKSTVDKHEKMVREGMGIRDGFFSSDPILDEQRILYNDILKTNVPLFDTSDMNLAYEKTNDEFNHLYKEDPGHAPPGRKVTNAITNLPWAKTSGNINKNQVAQALEEWHLRLEANPGVAFADNVTIKRSKKMPEFPHELSDVDKYTQDYAPDGYWMEMNGEDVKLYQISPTANSTNPFAPNGYQWFYSQGENTLRPLPSVDDTGIMQLSTMMTVYPPQIYTPDLVQKMADTSAQADITDAATKAVDASNKIRIQDYHLTPKPGQKSIEDLHESIRLRKTKIKEQEVIIRKKLKDEQDARAVKPPEGEE